MQLRCLPTIHERSHLNLRADSNNFTCQKMFNMNKSYATVLIDVNTQSIAVFCTGRHADFSCQSYVDTVGSVQVGTKGGDDVFGKACGASFAHNSVREVKFSFREHLFVMNPDGMAAIPRRAYGSVWTMWRTSKYTRVYLLGFFHYSHNELENLSTSLKG